jgi:hypothetical protein
MPTATAVPTGRAGNIPAQHVAVGSYVSEAGYIGHVTRVEEMVTIHPGMADAARTGFTDQVVGQPVLKFEIRVGESVAYFARFPHEPVTVLEV